MMDKFEWFFQNLFQGILNFFGGLIIALIAYLMEIKGTFHLMWITMVIDLFLGIVKSRRVNNEKFKMSKFLLWLLFVLVSTAVVAIVYSTEKELGGMSPVSYKGFIVLIIGFVVSSIVRNAEKITKKYVFTILLDEISRIFKRITGVDLNKYEKK